MKTIYNYPLEITDFQDIQTHERLPATSMNSGKTVNDMDKMEKIKKWVQKQMELYWEKLPDADDEHPTEIQLRDLGQYMAYESMESFLDILSEEPDKSLEEAAEDFVWEVMENDEDGISELCRKLRPTSKISDFYGALAEFFIAGANWQKEQDQPITGNSLEQEWLRYVDKKKKEYGGELPSLGDYGWLQIARHFAEWQKEQMMKEAVEVTIQSPILGPPMVCCIASGCSDGDKVKVIVLKAEEE